MNNKTFKASSYDDLCDILGSYDLSDTLNECIKLGTNKIGDIISAIKRKYPILKPIPIKYSDFQVYLVSYYSISLAIVPRFDIPIEKIYKSTGVGILTKEQYESLIKAVEEDE